MSHLLCANLSHLGIFLSTDFVPVEGTLSTLTLLDSMTTECEGVGRSTACEVTSGASGAGTWESSVLSSLRNFMMKQYAHDLTSHHQTSAIR